MRRSLSAIPVILVLLLVAIAASGCGQPPPAQGWVEGVVRIGPINPVEQPGTPNDRPYSASLLVKRASDGEVVAQTTSDEEGVFRVALPPGSYVLEPVNGDPMPTAPPQELTVSSGLVTRVRVDYDSGIR